MTLITQPLSKPFGTLSYRQAGPAQDTGAPPVLLVHGVGMQSAVWTPQLQALATQHRVIAVDMPGHGGSSCLTESVDLQAYVDWLLAVLDALDLPRVSLAGHSMGALIAGGFAVQHPDRLDRVALLNGVYCRDASARAAVVARAEDIRAGRFDLEAPLDRWFPDDPALQEARATTKSYLSAVPHEGYAAAYAAFAKGDATFAARYPEIACPFLALTGDQDANSTPAMSQAMAAAVQNGWAKTLPGHGHMMTLTAADQVSAILLDWLNFGKGDPT